MALQVCPFALQQLWWNVEERAELVDWGESFRGAPES